MKTSLFTFFFLALSLSSCYITDQVFLEKETSSPISLQTKAEKAITNRINSQLNDERYIPYGFSEVKIVKPVALLDIERLEKQLKETPNDTTIAGKLSRKKAYVRANKIESKLKLDHFFTLQKYTDTSTFTIFEMNYILNDTLGVNSADANILLELPVMYEEILNYYFNEYTIFMAKSYSEGRKLSRAFFRYYKTHLESLDNVSAKSAFLKHALNMSILVKKTGAFDQDYIKARLFEQYLIDKRTDITDYAGIETSQLFETKETETETLLGYYFFHKFIGTFNGVNDTNVVLVEMDPYYQIDQVFQLDQPYETYLK